MRDAFGGTFMLKLFMVFFIIYVSFIGVALNFAKIYRVKNNVINILEQYRYSGKTTVDNDIDNRLGSYLHSVPYQYRPSSAKDSLCYSKASEDKIDSYLFSNYGVCVVQKGEEGKHYYGVTVYHVIEMPIMNLSIPIAASGETIVIDTC